MVFEDELDAFEASLGPYQAAGNGASATTLKRKHDSNGDSKKAAKQPKVHKPAENRAIYVTNIPLDATFEEIEEVFKRYGIIDQSVNKKARINMYTNDDGEFNGEALIVYFKKESVELAIRITDGFEFRFGETKHGVMTVQEADPSRKKNTDKETIQSKMVRKDRKAVQQNKAELARKLAEWSDNEEEVKKTYAPKKNKWAKTAIVKKVFQLEDLEDEDDPEAILEIKQDMRGAAEKFGEVTKVVLFDLEPEGIVTVRFKDFDAAEKFRDKIGGKRYNNEDLVITLAEDRPKFKKSGKHNDPDSEDDFTKMEKFMNDEDD